MVCPEQVLPPCFATLAGCPLKQRYPYRPIPDQHNQRLEEQGYCNKEGVHFTATSARLILRKRPSHWFTSDVTYSTCSVQVKLDDNTTPRYLKLLTLSSSLSRTETERLFNLRNLESLPISIVWVLSTLRVSLLSFKQVAIKYKSAFRAQSRPAGFES